MQQVLCSGQQGPRQGKLSPRRSPGSAVRDYQGLRRLSKEVKPQVLEGQLLKMQDSERRSKSRWVKKEGRPEECEEGNRREAEGSGIPKWGSSIKGCRRVAEIVGPTSTAEARRGEGGRGAQNWEQSG